MIEQLRREIKDAREIFVQEPGIAPTEAAAKARELASIEIEMLALAAVAGPKLIASAKADVFDETLLAILGARLHLRVATFALQVTGLNASADRRGLGSNYRITPAQAEGVAERYFRAAAYAGGASQQYMETMCQHLFGQTSPEKPEVL